MKRGDAGQRTELVDPRRPVDKDPMVRRILRICGDMLPYLAWMIPLVDRMVTPKRQAVAPGLLTLSADLRNDLRGELKQHLAAIQAAQVDVTPAIEEQQRRLEKLEEHASELNHSLTNLSEDQLDLADQVRAMAGWVRNSAVAALFLLTLMFVLKLVQAIHGH
ncbi:MAG: hypothetical protein ACYCRE_03370 [Acidobacteriaceae bacterium]